VCSGQPEHFTNKVDQQEPRLDFRLTIAAIHFYADQLLLCHLVSTEG
jgi:hypothetical protein